MSNTVTGSFAHYNLTGIKPSYVLDLGDGVLRKIASRFGCDLEPTEQSLVGLMKAVGPHLTLQDNIEHVRTVLGPRAVSVAAGWMKESCVLDAVAGSFKNPAGMPIPGHVNAIAFTGGVANWYLRRLMVVLRQDPKAVGLVIVAAGNRFMNAGEHQLVATFIERKGRQPKEYEFAEHFIMPALRLAGFTCRLVSVEDRVGDVVCDKLFEEFPELVNGTVLAVGNAPSTIQGAGTLRAAARCVNRAFDDNGDQLFMVGDHFPLALRGEPKDTHQNPLSGITQIPRCGVNLIKAVEVNAA